MNFINLIFLCFTFGMTFVFTSCSNDTVEISYVNNLTFINSYSLEVPEPSGLCLGKNSETLWTVSDSPNNTIYQMDLKGNVIKTLDYVGDDFEGIAYDSLKNILYVIEEQKYSIVEVTTNGEKVAKTRTFFAGNEVNGFEGICLSDSNIYVANEKEPLVILKLNLNFIIVDSYNLVDLKDISGLCYDNVNNKIWGISDESKLLFCFDETNESIKYYPLPYDKMEGLAIDFTNNRIYIVNDSRNELFVYEFRN